MESAGPPALPDDGWSLSAVDESAFDAGTLGPYRLGPTARRTAWGEVIVALDEHNSVVEVDLLDALAASPLIAPESGLMTDIAAIAALRHRHVIPLVGAGVHDGVPYLVRPHRLGRTLASLLDVVTLPIEVGAVILHAVTEALVFLTEAGPNPSACAMGGFDARDVYLGYDGSVGLVGVGLRRARGHADDAREADLAACFALARSLERGVEARLPSAIAGANAVSDVSRLVRRRYGNACVHGAAHVGATMRRAFSGQLAEDRALFGLPPIH